jgi:hypothetical protein
VELDDSGRAGGLFYCLFHMGIKQTKVMRIVMTSLLFINSCEVCTTLIPSFHYESLDLDRFDELSYIYYLLILMKISGP